MQKLSDKEVSSINTLSEEPETDLVYLAHLEQQAELDKHQTEYEKGTIDL